MDVLGGAQIHVRDLSKGLKNEGHNVIVVSMGKGSVTEELKKYGIRYIQLKHLVLPIHLYHDVRTIIEMRNLLKRIQPDLLAIHSSKAGIIGRIVGKLVGIPTVFTAHGWAFTEGVPKRKRKRYRFFEYLAGKISQGVITVSSYDYQLAVKEKVIPKEKMNIIYNGVPDVEELLRSIPNRHPPKIMMVARFAFPKDHIQLIQALDKLQNLEWEVEFVGDGPLREEVQKYVKQSPVANRITFLGDRTDVPERLSAAQIFVLISKLEGLPISIIEAMRSGLPVIASEVGGVGEVVENEHNGFTIPSGNIDILTERLAKLINNPSLREKMGNASRKKYEESFTFETMKNETIQYYKNIIQEK